jgi:Choline/Carnitine o-acyltransferase
VHGHLPVRSGHRLLNPIRRQSSVHRWMFDCCRIPGPKGLDWSISCAKEGDLGDAGHIIVFRNNRVWKVEIAKDGRILSTDEIEKYVTHPNPSLVEWG